MISFVQESNVARGRSCSNGSPEMWSPEDQSAPQTHATCMSSHTFAEANEKSGPIVVSMPLLTRKFHKVHKCNGPTYFGSGSWPLVEVHEITIPPP